MEGQTSSRKILSGLLTRWILSLIICAPPISFTMIIVYYVAAGWIAPQLLQPEYCSYFVGFLVSSTISYVIRIGGILLWSECIMTFVIVPWIGKLRRINHYKRTVLMGALVALLFVTADPLLFMLTVFVPLVFSTSFVAYVMSEYVTFKVAASSIPAQSLYPEKLVILPPLADYKDRTGDWLLLLLLLLLIVVSPFGNVIVSALIETQVTFVPLWSLGTAFGAFVGWIAGIVISYPVKWITEDKAPARQNVPILKGVVFSSSIVLTVEPPTYYLILALPMLLMFASQVLLYLAAERLVSVVAQSGLIVGLSGLMVGLREPRPPPDAGDVVLKVVLRVFLSPLVLFIAAPFTVILAQVPALLTLEQLATISYSVWAPYRRSFTTWLNGSELPLIILFIITIETSILTWEYRRYRNIKTVASKHKDFELIQAVAYAGIATTLMVAPALDYGFASVMTAFSILTIIQYYLLKLTRFDYVRTGKITRLIGDRDLSSSAFLPLLALTGQILLSFQLRLLHLGFPTAIRILTVVLAIDVVIWILSFELGCYVVDVCRWRTDLPALLTTKTRLVQQILVLAIFLEFVRTSILIPFWPFVAAAATITVVSSIFRAVDKPRRISYMFVEHLWEKPQLGTEGISSRRAAIRFGQVGLVIMVIAVASWSTVLAYNLVLSPPGDVRVAVIDSGVNKEDPRLLLHVVAEKSFVTVENGYDFDDTSTVDTTDNGIHGTIVALLVLEMFPEAAIVNAKVFTDKGRDTGATSKAIVEAIRWSVEEQNVSVINLSLGFLGRSQQELDAIEWAWSKGVLVTISAGNEQNNVPSGGSVGSPGESSYAVTVGAVNAAGKLYGFSSWGPCPGPYLKPDLVVLGNFWGDEYTVGTSFSSPRVAGTAARLIAFCRNQGLSCTPGMLKAALLAGCAPVSYPEYKAGAGRLDSERSIEIIRRAQHIEETPFVSWVSPTRLPLDMDRLFTGTTYAFTVTITCSVNSTYVVEQVGGLPGILQVDSPIVVNQSQLTNLKLRIPESEVVSSHNISIVFSTRGVNRTIVFQTETKPPRAKVAIDLSHSIGYRDSIYGEYLGFYESLTSDLIAVTEIRSKSEFNESMLNGLDALIILEPYVSDERFFDEAEISLLRSFYSSGRGVFFGAAEDGWFQNTTHLNDIVNWTGAEYTGNGTLWSRHLNMSNHAIVSGVQDLEIGGLYLQFNSSFSVLASDGNLESGSALVICAEGLGRLVISGTCSLFRTQESPSESGPERMALRIAWWLCRLL